MQPKKSRTLQDVVDVEGRMQKWRRLTPIGLAANLITSIGGMGIAGWLAIHLITSFEQEIKSLNQKIDTGNAAVIQKIDQYAQKEDNDVLLLTQKQNADTLALNQKVYACCK